MQNILLYCFLSIANPTICDTSGISDSVVVYAHSFLGVPYVWAGCSPDGFDCSGFVNYVYKKFGYSIERSSSGLYSCGEKIDIENACKGDIILFTGTNPNDKSVGHAGIVVSGHGEPLKFIHASSSKKHPGVVVTDYYSSNYPQRFIGIRRVLK